MTQNRTSQHVWADYAAYQTTTRQNPQDKRDINAKRWTQKKGEEKRVIRQSGRAQ